MPLRSTAEPGAGILLLGDDGLGRMADAELFEVALKAGEGGRKEAAADVPVNIRDCGLPEPVCEYLADGFRKVLDAGIDLRPLVAPVLAGIEVPKSAG